MTVKLYKGRALPISMESENSLYSEDLASFTMGEGYDPKHSEGFVRLFGLPGTVARRAHANIPSQSMETA